MSDTPIEPEALPQSQPLPRADEARKARLAANLRANLKRRKAQARAMDGSED